MNESDYHARIRALNQVIKELKAQVLAMEQRLVAVEQSLAGRWNSAGGT